MADQIYVDAVGTPVIGTDVEGYTHRWHAAQDVVVVYDGRDVDTVHYLRGRPLDDWVRNVRDLRGWDEPGPEGDRLIDADLRLKEGRV